MKKGMLIFLVLIIIIVGGYFVFNNFMKKDNINQPSMGDNVQNEGDNQEDKNEFIEGTLTGFEDTHTVEIVTEKGPINCEVFDENMIEKLESLVDQKIKIEIRHNRQTNMNIILDII